MVDSSLLPVKRILLKISGESFGTEQPFELSEIDRIVDEIVDIYHHDIEIAIVMGGGNIIRGASLEKRGIPRTTGDDMGMLATVINALLLQELLCKREAKSCVITARSIEGIGEIYQCAKCLAYLAQKTILLFAGGTGHPYFTTDTAAALRAAEIDADCFLKGTKVDGVYEGYAPDDSSKGRKLDILTYEAAVSKQYGVMDLTAVTFCMEQKIPIRVFNLMKPGNLLRAVRGEIGTFIGSAPEDNNYKGKKYGKRKS